MPLLDHFHPPLLGRRHWEGFYSRWAAAIADALQIGKSVSLQISGPNPEIWSDTDFPEGTRYQLRLMLSVGQAVRIEPLSRAAVALTCGSVAVRMTILRKRTSVTGPFVELASAPARPTPHWKLAGAIPI
jgi:hypothetical protein